VNVLGIDTSTAAAAVCVRRSDGVAFESPVEPERLSRAPTHARELLPLIEQVVRESEVGWDDLDSVAVGVGPGGFTGLRIGIATARALAVSRSLEPRIVSSLAALSAGIAASVRLPLLDARRGEVCGALYEEGGERWPEFVLRPEVLVERLRDHSATPLAAGDGSLRFREALEAAGVEVAPADSTAHVVRGLHICRLAAETDAVPLEAVLPTYLRQPDTSRSQPQMADPQ